MSIADGAQFALSAGRAAAAELMFDTCTIVSLGAPVNDGVGGVTTPETPVYGTAQQPKPCKIQTYEAQESNPEAGGATKTVQRYTLHIPVGSYAPAVGHVATITSALADPYLVGRRYRVTALLHKTLATAYRLGVEEVL